jgi:hypothetical protein
MKAQNSQMWHTVTVQALQRNVTRDKTYRFSGFHGSCHLKLGIFWDFTLHSVRFVLMFHRDIWTVLQHPPQADSATLKMEAVYPPQNIRNKPLLYGFKPPTPRKGHYHIKGKNNLPYHKSLGWGTGQDRGAQYCLLLSATQVKIFIQKS